ncbi:low affinity immunoglobulin gamma Fc region receptor III-B-like isoform X2 [Dendropsophus ebraccatus]|uniref:low affinity immunoglobulin gamma Fc region receptor III-B-like isoform X2 n=1 Tax=Dendropsophus ebraccatus TaxID=150705 RepID=UPI003831A23D
MGPSWLKLLYYCPFPFPTVTSSGGGAEVKPVVTFSPNWRIILSYEPVTISCNIGSMAPKNPRYYWSKDGQRQSHHSQTIKINSTSSEHSGRYQCWTNSDLRSDPVRLDVVLSHLILQTPPIIYIGEPLTLRCHSYSWYIKTNTTFYKNKTVINFSENDNELRFAMVDWNVTGFYSCSRQISFNGVYRTYHATAMVTVRERPPLPSPSPDEKTSVSPWILLAAPLPLLSVPLLFFMCRRRHQQHTITESERKDKEEDDVCYTYIHPDYLQRGLPCERRDSHDYSTVYSLVTAAPTAMANVEGADA